MRNMCMRNQNVLGHAVNSERTETPGLLAVAHALYGSSKLAANVLPLLSSYVVL